jgi:hypothetical protein
MKLVILVGVIISSFNWFTPFGEKASFINLKTDRFALEDSVGRIYSFIDTLSLIFESIKYKV